MHTSGPWRYDREKVAIVSTTAFHDWQDADDEPVPVTVFTLHSACGGEDSAADIALATAAPELLTAARLAADALTPPRNSEESAALAIIRAAIAAATPTTA